MMKSKRWKTARTALTVLALFGLSIVLWVYFTKQALAAEKVAAQAKAQAEYDKRYPVKGRRTDLHGPQEPSLPETGAPPLDATGLPGSEPKRPRMRISRGKDE